MPQKLKQFVLRWLTTTVAVMVAANIGLGITYDTFEALLVASLLLGILNAFLRPLLVMLALPLLILTLGLFYFVINALLLELVGNVVKGFQVRGFWPALWGSLVISIITMVLNVLTGTRNSNVKVNYHRQAPPPRRDDNDNGPVIDV